jgi:hypothetical protein
VLDTLTPDASRVDSRILVVGFGGREAFDESSGLLWPAHRRGIYLRDVATAAAKGGAVAVVLVGYDSLSLLDGGAGREALASAPPLQQLGIIPLQEVLLYEPAGELPLATHYRVDDLSSSVAGVGLPIDHNRSGRTRTVSLLGRTMELTVGEPPVNAPPAGRAELAAVARTLVPSLALRAALSAPNVGPLASPSPSSLRLAQGSVPLENGALRVRWSRALDDASDASVVSALDVLGQGLTPQSYQGKIVLLGTTDSTQTDYIDTPIGPMPELLVQANVLNTLLTRAYERPVKAWVSALAAIVAVLLVMLAWRGRPRTALVVAVVIAAGWLATVRLVAGHGHLLDPLVVPIAVIAAVAFLAGRRLAGVKVIGANCACLAMSPPPSPANSSTAAALRAAGARLTVTVLFCDLRGFTAVVACLIPAQVRERSTATTGPLTSDPRAGWDRHAVHR